VLHLLAGKPLLEYVITTARQLGAQQIHTVYGHGGDSVTARLAHLKTQWVEQKQQLGTGHAVTQAISLVPDDAIVMVLYGDVPLISVTTLQKLIGMASMDKLALLTIRLDDPAGYGRIVRNIKGQATRIVEEKDATLDERAIKEVNTGMLAVNAARLRKWLALLKNNNTQGEYYLTDIVALAVNDGVAVATVAPASPMEVLGVNDKAQLAELERYYQETQAHQLMLRGIALADPKRFDLRGDLQAGSDVSIDVNVIIEGHVSLGDRVSIGPNTLIRNAKIGDDVQIMANCVIENAAIDNGCRIGPFARIRPETDLGKGVQIGNFVEVKKSSVGRDSKINHLSYIGDTTMGKNVNVGAGVIVCNYDGVDKHPTRIGDNAFIGSDSQLVAPVEIGAGATIGAGSTITHDAPPDKLTLSRAKQETLKHWERNSKKKK
jgi:bifunctional UDP-N-acetylglucosamine pyrophosphorylase/glucosamine-1-phosphate N-acetyltransferase